MTDSASPPAPITNLADARARIKELEEALDQALQLLVERDARLQFYERRICDLEERLESTEHR